MRAAVIDVGSNTVRLLVVEPTRAGFRSCHERKARLALGSEVEEAGFLSRTRIDVVADCVKAFAAFARKNGAAHVDVLITSPGRQARNGSDLAHALTRAARAPAQILSSDAEGMLAYRGAMAAVWPLPRGRALVCDVGGGSTQLVVGLGDRIVWQASLDVGSLRLTERYRLAKPREDRVAAARAELKGLLESLDLPEVACACATGGSASALGRLCGRKLDEQRIGVALQALAHSSPAEISREHGIGRWRSERLLGRAAA